jgi:hypothetical protein
MGRQRNRSSDAPPGPPAGDQPTPAGEAAEAPVPPADPPGPPAADAGDDLALDVAPHAAAEEQAPAPGRQVDPLDVAEVHRLRVAGRLFRVKRKHPAAGQALVEADSADDAVAGFLAGHPDAKAGDCKVEKLKP